jgi:CubicO group peptidase (beta-lactamase class C family)
MRRLLLTLTLFVLPLLAPVQADEFVLGRFGSYIESLRIQAGIPGVAAAIVGRTSIQWEQAFGEQDIASRIAMRTDTPFSVDGLTEIFTAALVLRCVEEGSLSLDDHLEQFGAGEPDTDTTIREVLTHTSPSGESLVYAYRPERFGALGTAVRLCSDDSYRETLGNLLERLAMTDSVPGMDILQLEPPAEGIPDPVTLERYAGVLERLATPYSVDQRGRASESVYPSQRLTPTSGLVSTVRDLAKFDLALKDGVLLEPDTLASAWERPTGGGGRPLPHAMGWFTQEAEGETIVWQYGIGDDASSSLVVSLPEREITFIMLANSQGLVKPFSLEEGDVTVSPFVRLFLGLFAR